MTFYVCLKTATNELYTEYDTFGKADEAFATAISHTVKREESGRYAGVVEVTKGRVDPKWGRVRHAQLTLNGTEERLT